MLNSKELLERTGISRATLNNYISWGIVPKPEVLPPEPGQGAAPRIGYFPDDVVGRIEEIHRLKREGWSMSRIAEHFGAPGSVTATAAPEMPPAPPPPATATAGRPALPKLTIADIAHPAYLVDHDFEVIWLNQAAGAGPLSGLSRAAADAPRNVFKFLLDSHAGSADSATQALHFHLGLAKQQGVGLPQLCRALPPDQAARLERLYGEAPQPLRQIVSQTPVSGVGDADRVRLYAVQFREGILFAFIPEGDASDHLISVLSQREAATGDLTRRRLPVLSQVAVLVSDLQHANRIWSELPAEEYFELINQIWLTVDPIFRRHHGTHGKHPGDGMVGYFFPQPDGGHLWNALEAAQEAREAMHRISSDWQLRKGWSTALYLNTGLDEGQQWLGTLRPGGQLEFTMQSAALNRAVRISEFSRFGAIWATKNLVSRLTPSQRERLTFGVRRPNGGREDFVPSIFSTVDQLTDPARPLSEQLKEIARLPITEIVDLSAPDTNVRGAVGHGPV